MFDFLTRLVYPRLVGPGQVGGSDDFHRKIDVVARQAIRSRCSRRPGWRGVALMKRARGGRLPEVERAG